MKIKYELIEEDLLEYQLYLASKNEKIAKGRKRLQILFPVIYVGVAIFAWFTSKNLIQSSAFLITAGIWYFVFPFIHKMIVKARLKSAIAKTHPNGTTIGVEAEFLSNSIKLFDMQKMNSINKNKIIDVVNLSERFLIRMQNNIALIVPKHAVKDETSLVKLLRSYKVPFVDEIEWKW